jgi:hypothetical protein
MCDCTVTILGPGQMLLWCDVGRREFTSASRVGACRRRPTHSSALISSSLLANLPSSLPSSPSSTTRAAHCCVDHCLLIHLSTKGELLGHRRRLLAFRVPRYLRFNRPEQHASSATLFFHGALLHPCAWHHRGSELRQRLECCCWC